MKRLCFAPLLLVLVAPSPAFAQSAGSQAFQQLKTLAGYWTGEVTTVPPVAIDGNPALVAVRENARGNAVMHELAVAGLPDDPITMFYLEGDRLTLTHYCDAGNRPRMAGTLSPDGKTLEFEFADLSGGNERGHMHRAAITFIDENHHTEDWTFLGPNGAPVRAHFDLRRMNVQRTSVH